MNKHALTLKLGLTALDKSCGRTDSESLGALLKQATNILDPKGYGHTPRHWLARRAIEACCEEIIRTGHVTVPLKVQFVERPDAPRYISVDLTPAALSSSSKKIIAFKPNAARIGHPRCSEIDRARAEKFNPFRPEAIMC